MSVRRVLLIGMWGGLVTTALFAGTVPLAVSPGDASKLVLIADTCPTFSWSQVDGAEGYELVVYRLGEEGEEAQPVLRQSLAGAVFGWTPSLDRCLERGEQYAWSVRALGRKTEWNWSPPRLFQVPAGPSRREFEAALRLVQTYLDAGSSVKPPSAAAEPESDADGEPPSASPVPAVASTSQLTVQGGVMADSFTGGVDDTQQGQLVLYGGSGLRDGGKLSLFNSAPYSHINTWTLHADGILNIEADGIVVAQLGLGSLWVYHLLGLTGNLDADSNERGSCEWTDLFSEEDSPMVCPKDRFVAGMECDHDYCDNVRLYCCEL